jgi:diacylglycerol kinase (ATP)
VTERFLAVVNPAAGGGRCGQLASAALDRVRQAGIDLQVERTNQPGEAVAIVRKAYATGVRNILSVGGDGTSFEIVNGLFPEAETQGRPTLAFLPLGTGNSFLRDFTTRGVEHTVEALRAGRRKRCDVIRLRHHGEDIYFLNLLSLGFAADVGEVTNRRFKHRGELGYILGVLARLLELNHQSFPHRLGGDVDWDRRESLFLSFSNSKFTGGKMMIAPNADPCDGRIEYVRWGPVGRLRLLWNFPRLFSGTHIEDERASRKAVERVEFDLDAPVNVMVDGEILSLRCRSLEVLAGVLDVIV